MKKVLLIVLLFPILLSMRAPVPAKPQVYAVIVGVSQYKDATLHYLKYAHRDAEAYRSFLESPQGGDVPTENIIMLTNDRAVRPAVLKALRDMFNRATENDVVIFYFSGHGVQDPKIPTDVYFATYDTENDNFTGSALLQDDVARQFTACKAKLKLFIADACHSGGSGLYLGTKGDDDGGNMLMKNVANIKEPNWAVLTASESNEQSQENERWGGGHGVFTYYLIKGLEGQADKTSRQDPKAKGNGDGIVTMRELYEYLNACIPGETGNLQHPDKRAADEENFPMSAVNADKYGMAVMKFKGSAPTSSPAPRAEESVKGNPQEVDLETKDMKAGICADNNYAYGSYCFYNNYGQDLLLTGYSSRLGYDNKANLLIAAGKKVCVERIKVSWVTNRIITNPSQNITFYFSTLDEGQPIKRGTHKLVLEACKLKADELTRQNLYLSVDGERF